MKTIEPKKNGENDNLDPGWMNYLGLGSQLAVTVVGLTFLGIWLDKKFNTEPVLTIICAFLGISAGMYNFIKTALKSH